MERSNGFSCGIVFNLYLIFLWFVPTETQIKVTVKEITVKLQDAKFVPVDFVLHKRALKSFATSVSCLVCFGPRMQCLVPQDKLV